MNIVGRRLLISFIFSFFAASAYRMIESNQSVTTKDQAIQYFTSRNIFSGIIVITRNGCHPCNQFKNILSQYMESNPGKRERVLLINSSDMNPQYIQDPSRIIVQLGVKAAPSTFKVTLGYGGHANIYQVVTPSSYQEIDALFY